MSLKGGIDNAIIIAIRGLTGDRVISAVHSGLLVTKLRAVPDLKGYILYHLFSNFNEPVNYPGGSC